MKQSFEAPSVKGECHRINGAIILLAVLTLVSGCDSTANTCQDYFGKRIGIQEAAVKLRINLTRQSEPVIGDGIVWGIVLDRIDRYCHARK